MEKGGDHPPGTFNWRNPPALRTMCVIVGERPHGAPEQRKPRIPMSPAPTPIHRRTFTLAFLGSLCMLGLVLWPFWNQIFLAFFNWRNRPALRTMCAIAGERPHGAPEQRKPRSP